MPVRSADRTAEKLLAATHELLVERAGQNASVSEICGRAQVNVAMIKYCFGGKDGLLDALLERALRQLTDELEQLSDGVCDPEATLRRHVIGIVRNYVRFPYVNRLMNERLLAADPEAVDRISQSFAIPARRWYAALLDDGQRVDGWQHFDPTLFFFSVIGLCEFLFSARLLLERAFGQEIDAELAHRYGGQVADLIVSGVAGRQLSDAPVAGPPLNLESGRPEGETRTDGD